MMYNLNVIIMKKLLTIVLFVCLTTISFAQSSDYTIHAIPVGNADSEIYAEEWADTYLTDNNEWIICYEGVWVTLSEDGKTITISEKRPNFVDASYILSPDEFIAHEEAMWDLPGDKQTKKFKYDYKIHGNTRYLVITVKAELSKKRHS